MLGILVVAGTFILLRKIETWMHQHLFKVGWLLTHNYQTTTILYYAIFLPGVILHEVTYWLVAGALNVGAEHSIKWPEAQEIGELKLNFVRISPRVGVYKRAFISAAPLLVALIIIWIAATNVFDLKTALEIMGRGDLNDLVDGLRHLTGAPDFWLWVYLIFTISNTMYPQVPKDLQGWRTIVGAVGVIVIVLAVVGVGQEAFQMVSTPISQFLTIFQSILVFIIFVNLLMIMVLGTAEAIIERVTGHSATFKRGKMITMTRAEAQAMQTRERERQRKQQQALAASNKRNAAADSNISSVYLLLLPVPGGPEEEFIAAPVYKIEPEPTPALPDRPAVSPRLGAEMLTLGDAPPAPPVAKPAALPEGTKPRRPAKTDTAASTEKTPSTITAPVTPAPAAKTPTPDQVNEAVQILRGPETPAESKSEPSVAASQVDEAVAAFRTRTPDPVKPPTAPQYNDNAALKAPAADVNKPSTSANRPAAPQKDDLDDLPAPTVKPYAPFQRPASPFGSAEDDDDDLDSLRPSAAVKPTSSTSTFRPVSPFDAKDDDEDGTPKPAAARPSAPSLLRPGAILGASANDDDEEDLGLESLRPSAVVKPSTSTFRPASPFGANTPKPQDDDDDDDLSAFRSAPPAAAKPAGTLSSPFNRPAAPFGSTPQPQDDDDDDLGTFGSTPPATAKPSVTLSSPFNRPAASFGNTPKPQDDDDDDDLGSFRTTPPAAAKPAGTPASPFKPNAPSPMSPFHRPASPFGPRTGDDKPASTPPRPAAPPSRFGAQPAAPFGSSPKPTPFGKSGNEDESLLNRPGAPRDTTDDLFEDMGRTPPTKRTTGMQPIVKTGGFGTSRPVPKSPLSSSRKQDDEDDEDDLDDLRYEDEDPRYLDEDEDVSSAEDDD